jgi:hypothetical protein
VVALLASVRRVVVIGCRLPTTTMTASCRPPDRRVVSNSESRHRCSNAQSSLSSLSARRLLDHIGGGTTSSFAARRLLDRITVVVAA